MTTTFYASPDHFAADRVTLPDDEAHHATRVLRKQAGDEVVVIDGVGGWHRVRLDEVCKRRVSGVVLETRHGVGEPGYELTLAAGLLKQRSRYETMLEKAVELGVGTLVPLQTARTEKERLRASRAENILLAATKQCGRSRLPVLSDVQSLPEVLADSYDRVLIAHEQIGPDDGLLQAVEGLPEQPRLLLLVGPEGGFTDDEVAEAQAAGARAVSLGPRRLRGETAAIVAAAGVQLALEA